MVQRIQQERGGLPARESDCQAVTAGQVAPTLVGQLRIGAGSLDRRWHILSERAIYLVVNAQSGKKPLFVELSERRKNLPK